MIYRFENWYADTFEQGAIGVSQPIVMEPSEQGDKKVLSANDQASSSARDFAGQDLFEDDDAATYRRAKAAVDELHRARRFEKSIKLK